MVPTLLGGLSPRAFLHRHWQKRPLLVRGALPAFRDPVTPARILALAKRPQVEARLVLERGGTRPWQVVHGPLSEAVARGLPASRWTVLVHAVDEHVPAVALLLDLFDFVPRWRVDDVMVSLAARLGSVGPHVDGYDVFLLQGRGRRRWRIARRFEAAHRPGLDLRVLRRFRPEREWVLEKGDMLYLPPGVAHHGVALDEECLTYSIGFRAPSHASLVAGFLARVVRGVDRSRLYGDPDLVPLREPARIDGRALARMRGIVAGALASLRGPEFARFAGEHLTEPRGERAPRRRRTSVARLRRALGTGGSLRRRPGARIAFVRDARGAILYADGREWPVPPGLADAVPVLAGRRRLPAAVLRPWLARPALMGLLTRLVSAGVFGLEAPPPGGGAGRARNGSRPAAGSSRRGRRR